MVQIEMWEPGLIENVTIANLAGRTLTGEVPMEKVVYIDIQQHRQTGAIELGRVRGVTISGIAATTRGRLVLTAQKGALIEDVVLRDILLDYPEIEDAAELAKTCRSTQNSNWNPDAQRANAVLVAENVKGLRAENIVARMPRAGKGVPAMHGAWFRGVTEAVVDCPLLGANNPRLEPISMRRSKVAVRAIGGA